jgi:predicted nucleotidyltransferase
MVDALQAPTEAFLPPALRIAAARLAEATRAEAVLLFGSRARGEAGPDSDWDLCVLLPDDIEPGSVTPLTLWPLVADLPLAIQVLPIRRSVFEAKRQDPNSLSREVARDGVVLLARHAA